MTAELHYRTGAPVLGAFPGHHRSSRGESGFEFRGHAALLDAPDPRRLDLHASLRDPFGDWRVRIYSQRKSIPVVMVADLSASMGFEAAPGAGEDGAKATAARPGVPPQTEPNKLHVIADFVDSLAWSAWRTGDSFGFIGCDDAVRPEFLQLPTRRRGAGAGVAQRLRGLRPEGRSADGLRAAFRHLGRQRALVFLVSDFHLPLALIDAVLTTLAAHEVVPVVLWDRREFGLRPARGLVQVVDPESGRQRLVWWRPALRLQWQDAHRRRREALRQAFAARRLKPLFLEGGFDAEAVTRHFHA